MIINEMKILRRLVSIMSYFQQNLRYILLISGAICFLPLLLNLPLDPPVDSDSNLAKAFESPFYHYSLVASIAVSIPMLMDYVLDLLYRDRSSRSESFIPRRDLVLGLLLPDIFLLCYVVPLRHYELYPCIVSARDAFYFFCFVSHMIKSGSPVWTHKTTSVLAIFVSAFKAFSSFDASLPKSKYPLFGMFTTITKYTAIFVVFSLFLWWFYRVYFNKESLPEKKLYEFNVYATSFFLLILSYVVLNLTIAGDNWTVNDWGYTSAYTYCISLFTTTVSVLNNRIVRIEAAATEQALETKKMFVRYISHEIRTPLNTVFLGLKLLQQETVAMGGNERTMATIRDIKESCNVSLEILNELLTFDKLESGILKLDAQHLVPWDFVKDTVKPFYVQAREAGISLQYDCSENLSEIFKGYCIHADPHKLAQVIRNLVSNALKFSPRGGDVVIKLQLIGALVEMSSKDNIMEGESNAAHGGSILRMQIVDGGAGISPENQKKLFKEIVQFNPGRLQAGGGSGLGLYITKGIVDLHNGSISVFSEGEGHGCTFTLELPLFTILDKKPGSIISAAVLGMESIAQSYSRSPRISNRIAPTRSTDSPLGLGLGTGIGTLTGTVRYDISPNSNHNRTRVSSPNPNPNQQPVRKPVVLVVDDSKMNRRMITRLFEGRSESCTEAENGHEAVELYKKSVSTSKPFDVILMDHRMPVMEGPEAIKAIRTLGYKGLIIGVTGNALACDMALFLSAGADQVLSKPLNMDELHRAIEERMEVAERQKPFPSRHVPIFRKLQLHRMSSLVGFHSIDNNDSEVNVEVPQSKETLSHRIAPVGVDKQASADLRLALLRQSF